MQPFPVGNLDTNRTQMSALVTSSQGATGQLQATQAGNQLLALQAQQLADLTAVVAAHGRAQNLESAQHAADPLAAGVVVLHGDVGDEHVVRRFHLALADVRAAATSPTSPESSSMTSWAPSPGPMAPTSRRTSSTRER